MTKIEPVAFSITCNGCHVGNISSTQDQATARMISLNADFPNDTRSVEGLYTKAQLRQLVEACASKADDMENSFNSVGGAIRELIKEMLP